MANCRDCGGTECFCRMSATIAALTEACQIFTQALGNEDGYLPAIGALKTRRALDLMKTARVKPVFHWEGR